MVVAEPLKEVVLVVLAPDVLLVVPGSDVLLLVERVVSKVKNLFVLLVVVRLVGFNVGFCVVRKNFVVFFVVLFVVGLLVFTIVDTPVIF